MCMFIMSDKPIAMGWHRTDNRIGVRNHVLAFSTVALTDRLVQLAAQRLPEVLTLTPGFSRGLRGPDARLQASITQDLIAHPNVGAVLVVTHDTKAALAMAETLSYLGRPYQVLALMGCNGYGDAIVQAESALRSLQGQAALQQRSPIFLADLMVALECGGSDATSAICANPAIGRFVDRLIDAGGTAIVSETAEFVGSEPVIRQQAVSNQVADRIIECIAREEAMMQQDGDDYRGVNPTTENIEAGLTTLIEKTMGAVSKIGKRPISGCLSFGQRPTTAGLYFMDTPFFSPASMTGMVSAGCQITLFAMGVFNPSGIPLSPTIKVCGNPQTLMTWANGIDVDVSEMLIGTMTLDQAASNIELKVNDCASGETTATERLLEGQIIVPRQLPAL